jgi:hypothetical protein
MEATTKTSLVCLFLKQAKRVNEKLNIMRTRKKGRRIVRLKIARKRDEMC